MTPLRGLLARLHGVLGGGRRDDDLSDEIDAHLDLLTEEHVRRGLARDDARVAARRAFGGIDQMKETYRDQRSLPLIDVLAQDVRFAVRLLAKDRGFTLVAVLVLALGIGSNTAMFSIINSLLLRALPVAEPHRLAVLSGDASPAHRNGGGWTYAIWDEIKRRPDLFENSCAWGVPSTRELPFTLGDGGEMRPLAGLFVSGRFFATLGVPALAGRSITSADDVRGGATGAIVMISYAFWQRHFGGSMAAVGATLRVNGIPFTVVGITPPGFFGAEVGRSFDVAMPLAAEPLFSGRDSALDMRHNWWLSVMVRLNPGQSIDAATAALRGVQAQIRDGAMPPRGRSTFLKAPFSLTPAAAGVSGLRRQYQRPLLTMLVVVVLVLLIACANIANLLLTRAAARKRELSVRVALGASGWRIGRQLLVESLLLSAAGAALGLAFAVWGGRALVAQLSTGSSPVFLDLSIDWRVLLFTVAITLLTAVLFGTAPALRAAHVAPIDALKEHTSGAHGIARARTSAALVVAQVAISLVLVVAATLFAKTFTRLANLRLGFAADHRLVVNVDANRTNLPTRERLVLYQRFADTVASLPGVAGAAASVATPLRSGVFGGGRVEVAGAPPMPDDESTALVNFVTPGWFATYGTRMIAGRDVDRRDRAGATPVTVVNQAFVRRFYPGRDALGGRVTQFPNRTTFGVVGVVEDTVYGSLRQGVRPTMYIPLLQYDWWDVPQPGITLTVRSAMESPLVHTRSIAAALGRLHGGLMFTFKPLSDQVDASLTQERIVAMLAGFFSILALLLACVGLYGVTAQAVKNRRTEIAVRIALGATQAQVMHLILGRVLVLVLAGIVSGGLVALWATRFVATLLFGLEPRDPATLLSAALTLAGVGALASAWPAARASRIEPTRVLREG